MILKQVLNVVVFNCGYTCPSIERERGEFHRMFNSFLQPAVPRLSSQARPKTEIRLLVKGLDATKQEYPPSFEGIDAIIISGSPNGAYQDLDWIHALDKYVSCLCPALNLKP